MSELDEYANPGPRYSKHGVVAGHGQGMTMRDFFAGQALAGEMAAQSPESGYWNGDAASELARRCYAIADAMMEARHE